MTSEEIVNLYTETFKSRLHNPPEIKHRYDPVSDLWAFEYKFVGADGQTYQESCLIPGSHTNDLQIKAVSHRMRAAFAFTFAQAGGYQCEKCLEHGFAEAFDMES